MDSKDIISKAKQSFENVLANELYGQIIRDDKHMNLLVEMMDVQKGGKVLDIGTGNGYIAFPIAELYPETQVIGIDIAESAIERNNKRAEDENFPNLHFYAFDGENYPIESNSIDTVVTRYAFHHFPNIKTVVQKISNLVHDGGKILISDPIRNVFDTNKIIDKFMQMKGDGHVAFYSQEEIEALFSEYGFNTAKVEITDMTFPFSHKNEYIELYNTLTPEEKDMYNIFIKDGTVWIGNIDVINIVFEKRKIAKTYSR